MVLLEIPVSEELKEAFNTFAETPSHFCLPATIVNERSIVPLEPIPFPSSPADDDSLFFESLPLLSPLVQPDTAIHLILRRTTDAQDFTAVTYVGDNLSDRRAKFYFPATRSSLVNGLGKERFATSFEASDAKEVLEKKEWEKRDADKNVATGAADDDKEAERRRNDLLGREERELIEVRRQEERERTMGKRDTGFGGSGSGQSKINLAIGDGVEEALKGLNASEGTAVVRLTIEPANETLTLISSESDVEPSALQDLISTSTAQYTFYKYPEDKGIVFIYTFPKDPEQGKSRMAHIKESMLHANSRFGVLEIAERQGIKSPYKLEQIEAKEVTAGKLDDVVNPRKEADAAPKPFARPRRPGR
ncbi:hypothetical protein AJ79_02430 [Helicocarpus griseus UAMH5409]|uniref:ADF-H domain-containing protein n=1 Tax=Helicocarpus griseus UAMH5409 TaxID=1447875 RepID=A0A2B7Y342_9EURO|nr:hypothetical protein AJ79_02430 [Helicocarpus griseus UAMH5409]